MSQRTSAARYARALFDVARAEADVVAVGTDVTAFADVVRAHPELVQATTSGALPISARRTLISTIAATLGVAKPVEKLMLMLADRGRLELVPALADVYQERLRQHQNVVHADVTVAAALTPEQEQALAVSLGRVTGKQVQVSVGVDPGIIGGVIARIGGTVYDGSVQTQLKKMRDQLVAQA